MKTLAFILCTLLCSCSIWDQSKYGTTEQGLNHRVNKLLWSERFFMLEEPSGLPEYSICFCQGQLLSIYRDINIVSPVSHLLFVSGPSDVSRFVIARIVREPINRMILAWSMADIEKESSKVVFPCSMHSNSESTITNEIFGIRIIATSFYTPPNPIFGSGIMVALAMRGVRLGTTPNSETTTRCLSTQITDVRLGESSAVTATSESALNVGSRYLSDNG